MFQRKRLYQNDIVYYQQHKRPYNTAIRQAQPRQPVAPPPTPAPPAPPPHNIVDDLTDKYGLDQAYITDADLSAIKNTLCISGTKISRPSDIYIYADITKVLRYGMLSQ